MKKMKIQYPDGKIHDVDCYEFAKAILDSGEIVYYIEYKDFTNRALNQFVDSYAVVKKVGDSWVKTTDHIEYATLVAHKVAELPISTLGDNLAYYSNFNYSYSSAIPKKEIIPQTQTEPKRTEINPPIPPSKK